MGIFGVQRMTSILVIAYMTPAHLTTRDLSPRDSAPSINLFALVPSYSNERRKPEEEAQETPLSVRAPY